MFMHDIHSSYRKDTGRIPRMIWQMPGWLGPMLLGACAVDGFDHTSASVANDQPLSITLGRQIGASVSGPKNQGNIGFAAAVAARAGYVYIVDSAAGALVQVDPVNSVARPVRRLPDARHHGLHVTADQIVYVVDRSSRSVLQIDETGQVRRALSDERLLPAPIDVAGTTRGSVIVVADELTNELVIFDPFFGPAEVIGDARFPANRAVSITAIAGGADSVFVLDGIQREVLEFDLFGRLIASFGEDDLRVPVALAVDDCNRVVVADGHPAGLYVSGSGPFGRPVRVPLDVAVDSAVTDLWIDGSELYVAAGTGGVQVFFMEPPCR